ncbi:MAG: histidine kinase, partial [Eubacteriales bacterium]|nr:histidine kinase [Eubacteriales bacterium]
MMRLIQKSRQTLRNTSIKKKYLFAILLLLVTLALGGAYTCIQGSIDACADRVVEAHDSFESNYKTMDRFEKRMLHLVNMFQQNRQVNELLSAMPQFASGEHIYNQQTLRQLLYTMLDASGDYTCRLYANPAIGITDETSPIRSLDAVAQTAWAKEALRGWGWHHFYSGKTLSANNPALIAPIRDLEDYTQLPAILRIDLREEALRRILKLPLDRAYLSCYLEAEDGSLVYTSQENISQVSLTVLDPDTVTGFAAQTLNTVTLEGNTVFYQTLPSSQWRLVLIVDGKALFASQLPRFVMLSLIACVLALCGILFASPIIWKTALRIRQFHQHVQSIDQTELHQRLEPESMDELGELIVAHNLLLDRIEALIKEQGEKDRELHRLEISALQAQIKPHFLYNTLEAISWMSKRDESDRVDQTVRNLTRFYRLCLSQGTDVLTVEKELEIIRYYYDIQSIRYNDVFHLEIAVSQEVRALELPKITLQPLVENALVHGILESGSAEGTTWVFSRVRPDGVRELCVADSGAHFSAADWEKALHST